MHHHQSRDRTIVHRHNHHHHHHRHHRTTTITTSITATATATTMASIALLPTELHIECLSYLDFLSQDSARKVCRLWRSIMKLRQFRMARYCSLEFNPREDPSDGQVYIRRPAKIHQLLCNDIPRSAQDGYDVSEPCFLERVVRDKISKKIYLSARLNGQYLTYSWGYPLRPNREILSVFLTGILHPKTMNITSYELWVEKRKISPQIDPFKDLFHKISLPDSHPYFQETVFEAEGPIPKVIKMQYAIRIPRKHRNETKTPKLRLGSRMRRYGGYQVELENHKLPVSPSMTVRDLTTAAWNNMMNQYRNRPEPVVERVTHVRFSISGSQWAAHILPYPVLQLDLEVQAESIGRVSYYDPARTTFRR
ncbi:hypothetical protein TWF730_002564 [Orbilia blumenaviensis]|uniref:F-box domain-containing protein n=1 Tax=Orbilia blumenaviensis TaxID=1796055 RepID=A0AAV9UDA1_9PEZI